MIDKNDIIKAYDETGITPCTISLFSHYGACAIGVYYLWMNNETLENALEDCEEGYAEPFLYRNAYDLATSILGENSVFFGCGFDDALNYRSTEQSNYKEIESYHNGHEVGTAVREWYKSKTKVEDKVLERV